MLLAVLLDVGVDRLRRAAQRELAQREQVAPLEEVLGRALRLLGQVDLALREPLQQLLGRDVDELDLVGALEHGVGHRLAHLDAGDLRDDVVEALDVLDVERRVDVDAGVEQLEHVLPALGVARAGRVGVRELVDEEQRRLARERGVEVELLELRARGTRPAARGSSSRPSEQRRGLGAAVGLDDADDDVDAVWRDQVARRLEHRVGLADARRGAEEDLQLRRAGALPPRPAPARAGRRDRPSIARSSVAVRSTSLLAPGRAASSARLSRSTLTRGSPRMPSVRPSTCASTSARTRGVGAAPRARATRPTW